MAKRKHKKRTSPSPTPRTLDVRHRLPPVELVKRDVLKIEPAKPKPKPDFRPVEDLRHDRQDRTFRTTSGRVARTVNRPQGEVQKRTLSAPVHTYFSDPKRVLVCVRRATRERVLFALRRIGKGKKVSRDHRWTDKSNMRCK